ncbi:RNA methyltransferase [Cytophagaceae bacterium ABcell3]|nr:RNA methyltransferase [Cytophagaceae bacterium ABcell3]
MEKTNWACSDSDDIEEGLKVYLSGFLTEERMARLKDVLGRRTRHLTVVMEDIHQPHNGNAVIRSCECFGIQDLHIIEHKSRFSISKKVGSGAWKWIDIKKYKGVHATEQCINSLKDKGYRVLAATPHTDDISIGDYQLDTKTAIMFGSEHTGLSPKAMDLADGFIKIPMHGFTESLNISVCAAIMIQNLREKLDASSLDWRLKEEEAEEIIRRWVRKSVKKPHMLEKQYFSIIKKA